MRRSVPHPTSPYKGEEQDCLQIRFPPFEATVHTQVGWTSFTVGLPPNPPCKGGLSNLLPFIRGGLRWGIGTTQQLK
jgi:hypothetical protein